VSGAEPGDTGDDHRPSGGPAGTGETDDTVDIVGIGFGPSNLGLAIAV